MLKPGEDGLFEPESGPRGPNPHGIKVHLAEQAPEPWDAATALVRFRLDDHAGAALAAEGDRLGQVRDPAAQRSGGAASRLDHPIARRAVRPDRVGGPADVHEAAGPDRQHALRVRRRRGRRARERIRSRPAHLRAGRRAAPRREEGAMISRVIAFCARRPWLVIGATALAAVGSYAAQRSLARDAIPDLVRPAHRRRRRVDGAPGDGRREPGHPRPDGGARSNPGRDGRARPVDVGHGVRRRGVRVGRGAGLRARRRSCGA